MLERFNPQYELPSGHYFSREAIPSLYAETRRTIEQFRSIKDFYYSGTTDLWSSSVMQPYTVYWEIFEVKYFREFRELYLIRENFISQNSVN